MLPKQRHVSEKRPMDVPIIFSPAFSGLWQVALNQIGVKVFSEIFWNYFLTAEHGEVRTPFPADRSTYTHTPQQPPLTAANVVYLVLRLPMPPCI